MKKKAILITAASATVVCAAGFTVTLIICKRLFEKNYFSVNSDNNFN